MFGCGASNNGRFNLSLPWKTYKYKKRVKEMEENTGRWRWMEMKYSKWMVPSNGSCLSSHSLLPNRMNEWIMPCFLLFSLKTQHKHAFLDIDYALSEIAHWARCKKSSWLKWPRAKRAPCAKRTYTWQLTSHVVSCAKRDCHT